jgi:hypothetical protein
MQKNRRKKPIRRGDSAQQIKDWLPSVVALIGALANWFKR